MKKNLILLFLVVFISGCKETGDFKEIREFEKGEWYLAHKQTFEFDIKDVSKTYQFNYLLRNSISYPFYNLYLQQKLVDSTGNEISSSLDEVLLFNEKTGKPYGDGSGNLFDCRIQAPKLQKVKFAKAGKYKWIISQTMRPDPLVGIVSLGVEVLENP